MMFVAFAKGFINAELFFTSVQFLPDDGRGRSIIGETLKIVYQRCI